MLSKFHKRIFALFLLVILSCSVNVKADATFSMLIKLEKPGSLIISKDYVDIQGYAVSKYPLAKVNIYLDGKILGQATVGIERKDVAKLYPKYLSSLNSGFTYKLNVKNCSDGLHEVRLEAVDKKGVKVVTTFKVQVQKQRTEIMGQTEVTKEQMVKYFKINNSSKSDAYIDTFITCLMKEASIEGIRAEIALAQTMYETNNFKYTGAIKENQNNFFSLSDNSGSKNGASFKDISTGIRAGIQHLKAYASKETLKQAVVDPRYKQVTKGCAPYVEWLGAKENPYGLGWTSVKNYGNEIISRVNAIKEIKIDKTTAGAKFIKVEMPSETYPGSKIDFKAEVASQNKMLYKFTVADSASGKFIITQDYSDKKIFSWSPEKLGSFNVIITVRDEKSTKEYDDIVTKPLVVKAQSTVLSSKTIVIDPGHGGYDAGAVRGKGDKGETYKEKDLNNSLSLQISEKLKSYGAKVVYTKDPGKDVFMSLEEREKIANESKGDLFLSIHHDASANSAISGTSVHYSSYKPGVEAQDVYVAYNGAKYKMIRPGNGGFFINYKGKEKFLSVNEATAIDYTPSEAAAKSAELAKGLVDSIASLGLNNRGSQDHNLSVTRSTNMPSVLIEAGFISNDAEAEKLADISFQEKIAKKIADVVAFFFK
jgi:N-acetylmuramoyl-L-alanine amidase